MDDHSPSGGELLVADMALEVLRLLMLHQDLLVVEFPVAVVAPHFRSPLFLLPHPLSSVIGDQTLRLVFFSSFPLPSIRRPWERGRFRIRARVWQIAFWGRWRREPTSPSLRLSISTRRGIVLVTK